MGTTELESNLRRIIRTRRIVLAALTLSLFIVFGVSYWLLDASMKVTQDPIIIDGMVVRPGFEHKQYNESYIPWLTFGLMGAGLVGSILLGDLLSTRFRTITKNKQDLTLYRGLLYRIVYVNGSEQGRLGLFTYTNVVEVWLPDKIRATISFGLRTRYIAHISFSDHTTSIEI